MVGCRQGGEHQDRLSSRRVGAAALREIKDFTTLTAEWKAPT
jgi:hypothetical protein